MKYEIPKQFQLITVERARILTCYDNGGEIVTREETIYARILWNEIERLRESRDAEMQTAVEAMQKQNDQIARLRNQIREQSAAEAQRLQWEDADAFRTQIADNAKTIETLRDQMREQAETALALRDEITALTAMLTRAVADRDAAQHKFDTAQGEVHAARAEANILRAEIEQHWRPKVRGFEQVMEIVKLEREQKVTLHDRYTMAALTIIRATANGPLEKATHDVVTLARLTADECLRQRDQVK